MNGTRLLENGLAEETECGYRSPLQHLQNVNAMGILSENADCTSCLLRTESIFFFGEAKGRFERLIWLNYQPRLFFKGDGCYN